MSNTAGTPPSFDPYRRIASVLAGSARYDDLGDPRSQEVVRAVHLRQVQAVDLGLKVLLTGPLPFLLTY